MDDEKLPPSRVVMLPEPGKDLPDTPELFLRLLTEQLAGWFPEVEPPEVVSAKVEWVRERVGAAYRKYRANAEPGL